MDLNSLFITFLILFSAYLLASSSGLISEKSGTVNISIEGTMIMGATIYSLLMNGNGLGWQDSMGSTGVILAMLMSGVIGVIFGLALGSATSFFKADNIIAGTALNLLAPTLFIMIRFSVTGGDFPLDTQPIWTIASWLPYLILSISLTIALTLWIILNKTIVGLRLRTAGENPYSLETAGKSTNRTRFITLLFAGFLAGMSGAMIRMAEWNEFVGTVYGAGFISLGIVIFGQWKIQGVVIGSAIIAILLATIQVFSAELEFVEKYKDLFSIIPFVIPLITLMLFKKVSPPAAAGKPFSKSNRM